MMLAVRATQDNLGMLGFSCSKKGDREGREEAEKTRSGFSS